MMKVSAKIVNYITIANNLLFYCYNFIFKNHQTPKEKREFQCFMCNKHFVFPITSKDYMACNECWKTL